MKLHESGRSMVEMIGVLAIIGLLSIGSLAAYDYTKARARTTSIVDVASKLLAIARVKGKEVSTFTEKMEYTIDNYQIAGTARIDENEKGIVVICGCNIDENFENRLEQISGVSVETVGRPEKLSRIKSCGNGEPYECFQLEFPSKPTE